MPVGPEHAAANNAAWCDAMCRSHGHRTAWTDSAWSSRTRSPPLYPDAVTLTPSATEVELLGRVDAGSGCSIKDSFASLDLRPFGFRVLFEAIWMRAAAHGPPGPAVAGWTVVDPPRLQTWETAWRQPGDPAGLFLPGLLAHPGVTLLAREEEGRVQAGAASMCASGVNGVTNFFSCASDQAPDWASCLDGVRARSPDLPVVTYGPASPALAGFIPLGPLRVWVHDG